MGHNAQVSSSPSADPPLTRAEQARRTRARIREVALRLFADKGYDATSLQDIADEMGLTKPAVYYHYKGKPEILKDLTAPARLAMADLMTRVRALPLGPARTDMLVSGLADLAIARRDVMRIAAQQPAMREDMHAGLGARLIADNVIEAMFGPEPTLDQRFAVYASAAVSQGVWALGDVPEDVLRGVVERALHRIAAVR